MAPDGPGENKSRSGVDAYTARTRKGLGSNESESPFTTEGEAEVEGQRASARSSGPGPSLTSSLVCIPENSSFIADSHLRVTVGAGRGVPRVCEHLGSEHFRHISTFSWRRVKILSWRLSVKMTTFPPISYFLTFTRGTLTRAERIENHLPCSLSTHPSFTTNSL